MHLSEWRPIIGFLRRTAELFKQWADNAEYKATLKRVWAAIRYDKDSSAQRLGYPRAIHYDDLLWDIILKGNIMDSVDGARDFIKKAKKDGDLFDLGGCFYYPDDPYYPKT